MKTTIELELLEHIEDCKKDFDEITHFNMFNEDYFIGYYNARKWLDRHNIGVFEGIEICREYEIEYFGENNTYIDNYEKLVNQLVYWYGIDLCNELNISLD